LIILPFTCLYSTICFVSGSFFVVVSVVVVVVVVVAFVLVVVYRFEECTAHSVNTFAFSSPLPLPIH